jgi:hypothetical protein
MAINHFGMFHDINRDIFYSEQERFEREMHQRKMYAAQQQQAWWIGDSPKPKSKPDLNDPLSFLSKADTKILLTGEAS